MVTLSSLHGSDARSFEEMVKSIRHCLYYANIIKTAAAIKWFTTGTFLIKVRDAEQDFFIDLYRKLAEENPENERAWTLPLDKIVQKQTGPELEFVETIPCQKEYPYKPSVTILESKFTDVVRVPTWMYLTFKKKFPNCDFHLTSWQNYAEELPLLVVNKKRKVGLMMPFNVQYP